MPIWWLLVMVDRGNETTLDQASGTCQAWGMRQGAGCSSWENPSLARTKCMGSLLVECGNDPEHCTHQHSYCGTTQSTYSASM